MTFPWHPDDDEAAHPAPPDATGPKDGHVSEWEKFRAAAPMPNYRHSRRYLVVGLVVAIATGAGVFVLATTHHGDNVRGEDSRAQGGGGYSDLATVQAQYIKSLNDRSAEELMKTLCADQSADLNGLAHELIGISNAYSTQDPQLSPPDPGREVSDVATSTGSMTVAGLSNGQTVSVEESFVLTYNRYSGKWCIETISSGTP